MAKRHVMVFMDSVSALYVYHLFSKSKKRFAVNIASTNINKASPTTCFSEYGIAEFIAVKTKIIYSILTMRKNRACANIERLLVIS
nr:hypothetical protein [Aeromonas salmonicida]